MVIMIGNVPQGLPTTVTACLFIVAERMGKHNVFVKKLDIIETLGSCTLICTGKKINEIFRNKKVVRKEIKGHERKEMKRKKKK